MPIDLVRIGKFLKEKREEKGLSIVNVSKVLLLRKSAIEAIENGNWDNLPHQVYVKGYIREYANFLDISNQLAPFLVDVVEPPITENIPVPQENTTPRRRIPKRVFIYSSIIFILISVFIYEQTQKIQIIPQNYDNTEQVSTKPNPADVKTDKKPAPELPEVKRLMVTCHERSWVSIVIDGAEKKEFMLSPHEIIMLNAKEGFDLLIGNAGGVKLFLNGKDTGFTGKNGEVKRIKLS